jgi:hypothetical protein
MRFFVFLILCPMLVGCTIGNVTTTTTKLNETSTRVNVFGWSLGPGRTADKSVETVALPNIKIGP